MKLPVGNLQPRISRWKIFNTVCQVLSIHKIHLAEIPDNVVEDSCFIKISKGQLFKKILFIKNSTYYIKRSWLTSLLEVQTCGDSRPRSYSVADVEEESFDNEYSEVEDEGGARAQV